MVDWSNLAGISLIEATLAVMDDMSQVKHIRNNDGDGWLVSVPDVGLLILQVDIFRRWVAIRMHESELDVQCTVTWPDWLGIRRSLVDDNMDVVAGAHAYRVINDILQQPR